MRKTINVMIVLIAIVGGFVYLSQKKEAVQTPVLSHQTYVDPSGDFSFDYIGTPGQLVSVNANGTVAYALRNVNINSSDTTQTSLIVYSDKSVSDWETYAKNDGSVEYFLPRWPLSVSGLLISKKVGYDCLKDFGYSTTSNQTCEIVNINGTKAFKAIMGVSNQADTTQYKYVFYKNGTWYEFVKSFYDKNMSSDQLEKLTGKVYDEQIQKEVQDFNDLISTVKFKNVP